MMHFTINSLSDTNEFNALEDAIDALGDGEVAVSLRQQHGAIRIYRGEGGVVVDVLRKDWCDKHHDTKSARRQVSREIVQQLKC